MTETVGKRALKLDWYIYPNVPIHATWVTTKNGTAWPLPVGASVWLIVSDQCYEDKRFDAVISGANVTIDIPETETQKIPEGSKFWLYIQYAPDSVPVLWRTGRGVRSGW